ncbi:Leader peptidase (Prepilin peptidase) / N-methyltransferase [hydrothermal vent metagenome]|uniref:Leader peptidase (Prepilin peptidase) / N-methyltransferase n=1 Tax=hydrothermal vent metagenome TaxID=652676 RepID=A0A3B1E5C6_9ZZZZ
MEFIFIFTLGACIGSFCNVLIYRTPKNIEIVNSRSRCTKCNTQLFWWHNIPIISFIFLRAKCYFCKKSIPFSYPIIEILTATIWIILMYKMGLTLEFLLMSIIFSLLLTLTAIDIHQKAVPDSINISALTLTFLYGMFSYDFINHITNMLVVLAIFYLIRLYMSYFLKQEAMGEGDIIIGAIMGGIIGIKLSLLGIFLASILALPFSIYSRIKGELELAFIPFLASAIFIIFIFNDISKDIMTYVTS